MTKTWFNRKTGKQAIFEDDANISDWPDFQETLPPDHLEAAMRHKRMILLSQSDTWALTDRTMTADQAAYRQALRDITLHSNWPDLSGDDWPVYPGV